MALRWAASVRKDEPQPKVMPSSLGCRHTSAHTSQGRTYLGCVLNPHSWYLVVVHVLHLHYTINIYSEGVSTSSLGSKCNERTIELSGHDVRRKLGARFEINDHDDVIAQMSLALNLLLVEWKIGQHCGDVKHDPLISKLGID